MTEKPAAEPPPGRRVRRRGPRRDALANQRRLSAAAAEVFARLGPSARLEDIAQHAGLGVGTAYRHLGSREAALHEVLARRITDLVAVADRADAIADPWDALSWYVSELAAQVAADRGVMALIISQGVGADQFELLRTSIEPRTAALMDRAKAAGQLRSDVTETDLPLLLLCVDRVAENTAEVAPDTWRRFLCLALDGLRAHRTSATAMTAPPLTGPQLAEISTARASRRPR